MCGIFLCLYFAGIRESFLKHLAQTSPTPPMYEFVRAEGIYLYDKQGKAYLDLISGISVNNIGHRHPKVVQAVKDQADQYMHQMVYGEYIIGPQVKLAEALRDRTPSQFQSFYFVNSGSEAIEGALKLAKKASGRSKVVAVRNAYHGSSTGALSMMSHPYYSGSFKPLLPNVYFIDLNDEESLNIIDEETAVVFIEPVQAESGYSVPNHEFLQALNERCKKLGVLIAADEVQSGMKRTGKMWAHADTALKPDILIMAKGLGGGMPIGCFAASRELMSALQDQPILGHITTFGGHPVSCAAALACLSVLDDIQEEDILQKEQVFRSLLKHDSIQSITGRGLMLAIHLESFEQVQKVIEYCFDQGLIIDWFLYANRALRIAPPLVISVEEIKEVCRIIIEALNAC